MAGPIAFPAFKGDDVAVFCRDLLDRSGVLLLPGNLYGNAYNNFRIGFGRQNLPDCLQQLERVLTT